MADEMKITFETNLTEVSEEIDQAITEWLIEASNELRSDVVKISRRRTGQTAASYETAVDGAKKEAFVGSNLQNAIWEEFGTGEYALHGDGRKGGWWYHNPNATYNKDGSLRKNSKEKEWIFTYGKHPNRPIYRAFTNGRGKAQRGLVKKLKALENK